MSDSYKVKLDVFDGPLDLLLFLVRKNEIDILRLEIARITQQFLEYLEVLTLIDLDFVGDFVVMASALVEIKSREALPQPEEEPEPDALIDSDDDPKGDLVRKLLEYKKYKEAATSLETQAALWQERYPRLTNDRPDVTKDPARDRIKGVELWDLVSALARVLQAKEVTQIGKMKLDETPIGVYSEQIRQRVQVEKRVTFSSCFKGTTDRSKIVGIFLAILEMLRHHQYRAEQPEEHGEIWILPPLEEE